MKDCDSYLVWDYGKFCVSVPRILVEVGRWKGAKRLRRGALEVLVVYFDTITKFVFIVSGCVSLV